MQAAMDVLGAFAGILAALLAVGGLLIRPVTRDIAGLRKESRRTLEILTAKVDGLILAISEVLPHIHPRPGEHSALGYESFRKALLRLLVPALAAERAVGNPLSPEEIRRMEQYQALLERRMLNATEAADFLRLAGKLAASHPEDLAAVSLAALAALVLGIAVLHDPPERS